MQEKSSEEARRDFRRILNDAERGIHTEITRYGDGVANLVPCAWMDQVIQLLADLRQAEAGWDVFVPIDSLRGVAKVAAVLLAEAADDEQAAALDEEVRQYVEELRRRRDAN